MSNYYDLLGVNRNSSLNEIINAFKNKIQSTFDSNELNNLTKAYQTLTNYHKKNKYNQYLDSINNQEIIIDNDLINTAKSNNFLNIEANINHYFKKFDQYFNNSRKKMLESFNNMTNNNEAKSFSKSYQAITYYENGVKKSKIIKKINNNGETYEKHVDVDGNNKNVQYFYPKETIKTLK